MPIYEFRCPDCGADESLFVRSMSATVTAPVCPDVRCKKTQPMARALSKFARHLTEGDQMVEAEAKWGKQMDSIMGPKPDIGRMARRYDRLAKDLPPSEKG